MGRRPQGWLLVLIAFGIAAFALPFTLINGSTGKAWSSRRPSFATRTTAQPVDEVAASIANDFAMQPSELEGVGHAIGVLDAVRRAVAALPAVADATAAVAADLNRTRVQLNRTGERLEAAYAGIERLRQQVASLQEPWTGHAGEVLCSAGHRCASYIDAGKTNLTALTSVAACGDYCTRTFATNFWAFHNEYGWIAFMLDPKGRCRCFDSSPCERVPDGGYNLWTSAPSCSVDLVDPSTRTATLEARPAEIERPTTSLDLGRGD